ncbi:MAG: hypothetical protein K2M91_12340 [Lachnospiraceae bacterium]|nr:hypothetical protein [Lachnospiraceae bacterium]
MDENNKFETDTDGSGGGSSLYGTEPQPQSTIEESGYSSVYGTRLQPQETEKTELTEPIKPSQAVDLKKNVEETMAAEEGQTAEPTQVVELTKSFEETKISGEEQPLEPTQTVELTKPVEGTQQDDAGRAVREFYEQQVNGNRMNGSMINQNPMGYGPIQDAPLVQGAPVPRQKKNKSGFVVGMLCAAAVLIVIVVVALLTKSLFGGDAKQQLVKGLANMAKEMTAYQSSIAEDIGLVELNKLKATKPVHTNMDLSFTDPKGTGKISNIDIEIDAVTDYPKKMASYDVSAGTYGINMSIGNIVAADNTLYVSVPLVFHDEVYSIDLTHLGRDFNNSAWSSLINETLPDDYSITLFDNTKATDIFKSAGEESELYRIINKRSKAAAGSVQYETIDEKRAFTLDGTSAEYGGVQVTIDRDTYNAMMEGIGNDILVSDFYADFLNGYQMSYGVDLDLFRENFDNLVKEMFGLRIEQDAVINFYLDKTGRIVNISTPEDIEVSSQYSDIEYVAVDINFSGKERTLDTIEGGMYVQTGDEILFLGISRNASIEDDYYNEDLTISLQEDSGDEEITFGYTNTWGYDDKTFDLEMSMDVSGDSIGFRADGAYTDIVKGEGYTFRLNHATLSIDDEDRLIMAGSIMTEPTDNKIEVPKKVTNILEMSESEIASLFYGILY